MANIKVFNDVTGDQLGLAKVEGEDRVAVWPVAQEMVTFHLHLDEAERLAIAILHEVSCIKEKVGQ